MPNSYIQLYVQFVFAVKGRQNLIQNTLKDELERFICGIIANQHCKVFAIYCNPDHTHVFVSMHPEISPAKLMEHVKSGSSKWINENKFLPDKFEWQKGYGAFSYSKSQSGRVVNYILNQAEHHKKQSFKDEYLWLLEKFGIKFEHKYVFEFYEYE